MTLSQELWNANQALAHANLTHPFVQGIRDGSLSRDRFAFYVGQDTFFLEAFARGYSIAAAKAPDWAGFTAFHELAGGVLGELELHEEYAAQWSGNIRNVEPSPATRRYTDFLLATAWQHEVGVTAVALSPCMRLYAFLGQELAGEGIPDHDYADWIQTYSSDDFEAFAQQLEGLTDLYADDTPLIRSTYRYAMECELGFFQAAWDHSSETA